MQRWTLNALAIISLAVLATVVGGVFASTSVTTWSNIPSRHVKIFKLYRAQFEFFRVDYPPTGPMLVSRPVYKWDGILMPGVKALWGFEAGVMPPGSIWTSKGSTVYHIAFPIAYVAVPFLIAPTLWLRKWRRARLEKGDSSTAFPVVQNR